MINWTDVPRSITYDGAYIKDLSESEAFEVLVAKALDARLAAAQTEHYDVYDSKLFPDVRFQVKFSNPHEHDPVVKVVDGRLATWRQSPTWSWSEAHALGADWYVLFGRMGDAVYPFACPVSLWSKESYDTGTGGRLLTISTDEYSACGRYASSYKRNKFWGHYLRQWPDSLIERIEYYRVYRHEQQMSFDLAGIA